MVESNNKGDLNKLYDVVSERFDIGDFESYSKKMQTPEDRKRFYETVEKQNLSLGDYDEYESRLSGSGPVITRIPNKHNIDTVKDLKVQQFPRPVEEKEEEESYMSAVWNALKSGTQRAVGGTMNAIRDAGKYSNPGLALAATKENAEEEIQKQLDVFDGKAGDERLDKAKELQAKALSRYGGKDFQALWEEGDYAGSLGEVFLQVATSAPEAVVGIGAAALGAPSVSMGLAFNTSFQSRYHELENDPNSAHMSGEDKLMNAILTGGAEAGSEMLGSIPVGKMIRRVYGKLGKEAAEDLVKKTLLQKLFKGTKDATFPVLAEASEEMFSSAAGTVTNLVTGYTNEIDFEKAWEKTWKSGVYGGTGGGVLGSVAIPGYIQNAKRKKQFIKDYEENVKPFLFEDGNFHNGKDLDGNDVFVVGETESAYIVNDDKGAKRFVSKTEITDIRVEAPEDFASSILASRDLSKEDVVSTDKYTLPDGSVVTKVSEAIMEDGRVAVHDADGDPMFVDPNTLTPLETSTVESSQADTPVVGDVQNIAPQESVVEYPRDKKGDVSYDEISDPSILAQATQEEFGDESIDVINDLMLAQQELLDKATKSKDPVDRRRQTKRVNERISILNGAKELLSPTAQQESTQDIAIPIEEIQSPQSMAEVHQIAMESEDPELILSTYEIEKEDIKNTLEPWQNDLLGTNIDSEQLVRMVGDAHMSDAIKRNWVRSGENINTRKIDELAQELSSAHGLDITPQAVADFIVDNPSNYARKTSVETNELSKHFSDIASRKSGYKIGGPESTTGRLFLNAERLKTKLEESEVRKAQEVDGDAENQVDFIDYEIEDNKPVLDEIESYEDGEAVSIDDYNDVMTALNEVRNERLENGRQREVAENQSENSSKGNTPRELDSANEVQESSSRVIETDNQDGELHRRAVNGDAERVRRAESEVNTSPTESQKEAGNYKKGHVKVHGLDITIEQPKGSTRSGVDESGKEWSVTMNNTYGYIRGTIGKDGDHIDVFLGDNPESGKVFVVDQVGKDKSFDEHKVMLGFDSIEDAEADYLANYEEGWQGLGRIIEIPAYVFKKWIKSSKRKQKAFADYKNVKSDTESAFGRQNKVITHDKHLSNREKLKAKLNQLNSGVDPDMMSLVIEEAAYYIEAGVRSFRDFSAKMIAEYGNKVIPYLKTAYSGVRYYPGMENVSKEMTTLQDVEDYVIPNLKEDAKLRSENTQSDSDIRNEVQTDKLTHESEHGGDKRAVRQRGRGEKQNNGRSSTEHEGRILRESGSDISGIPTVAIREPSDTDVSERNEGELFTRSEQYGGVERGDKKGLPIDESRGVAKSNDSRVSDSHVSRISDLESIKIELPQLYAEQQTDVLKAEQRFFTAENKGKGMLFTNGTGTGKTFTGLGVIKRFLNRGKGNVLVVVPTDAKAKDWAKDGSLLDISMTQLKDTQDGGKDVVVTTYANFYQNKGLLGRDFDLIVYDESHYLGQGQKGLASSVHSAHKTIARLPSSAKIIAAQELESKKPLHPNYDSMTPDQESIASANYREQYREWEGVVHDRAVELSNSVNVIMLSASPFAYHDNLLYGDGTLFTIYEHFNDDNRSYGYNEASGFGKFLTENFGYRMRYNKVTKPEAEVNIGLMERAFHDRMVDNGVISGRQLVVDKDYSREFIEFSSDIANSINEGMALFYDYNNKEFREKYPNIIERVHRKWNYLYTNQLLEGIKVKEAIPRIKEHLALGRKVVVFHNYNNGLPSHPFSFTIYDLLKGEDLSKYSSQESENLRKKIFNEIDMFNSEYSHLVNLDLNDLSNVRTTIGEEFPDNSREFNGIVSKTKRVLYKDEFNKKGSGVDILLIQRKAGKEGISLHDVDGDCQRVLIDLGLPTAPTDAIQTEGRIYRLGVKSNAIIEYPVLKTQFEQRAFAQTIAQRAKTAENLAMGSKARDMETAFKDGYLGSTFDSPSLEQGQGGKDSDKSMDAISEFDKAKTYYFSKQKKTKANKAKEGVDYFATPEPLGYKMVQWANIRTNESVLEPSAGHGAIARFFPGDTRNTFVEPSYKLSAELGLNSVGEIKQDMFENHHIVNKYDVVVMNPPFGSSGKTAMEHVEKAFKHLREGGRVVAIVPNGSSMNKRLDKFLYGTNEKGKLINPTACLVAEIDLPTSVFERAGTSVSAKVVVIDNISTDHNIVTQKLSLQSSENVNNFFDRVEDIEISERVKVEIKESTEVTSEIKSIESNNPKISTYTHSQTGETLSLIVLPSRVDRDDFSKLKSIAKDHNGYYSRYAKGFLFKDGKDAESALNDTSGDVRFRAKDNQVDSEVRKENSNFTENIDNGKGLEQDNDGGRRYDGSGIREVSSEQTPSNGDRSDIRVFEAGLESQSNIRTEYNKKALQRESERIVEVAKENDLFIPLNDTKSLGVKNPDPSGESVVYIDKAKGKVYKVKDPFAKGPMKNLQSQDVIYEHIVHNRLFPNTKYTFEGVSEDLGDVRIVLSQDFVSGFDSATQEQIDNYLINELGLKKDGYFYSNDYVSITDVSAISDNVLLGSDGELYFIDPIIKFNKSAIRVIDSLESTGSSIENVIKETSKGLGSPVKTVKTRTELPANIQKQMNNGVRYPGMHDPNTGEVFIVLDEIIDEADARDTVLHEMLGHKGLRALKGEGFDMFLDDVFKSMPKAKQTEYMERFNGDKLLATEEYLAEFAEGYVDPTKWEKVKAIIKEFLRSIGFNTMMSDADLMYTLWKAKNRLAKDARLDEVIEHVAKDNGVQGVLFRGKEDKGKRKKIEGFAAEKDTFSKVFTRKLIDGMVDADDLVKEVKSRGGKVSMEYNMYELHHLATSKSKHQADQFTKKLMTPINDDLKKFAKKGKTLDDIEMYMRSKHAPERNDHLSNKSEGKVEEGSGISTEKANETVKEFESSFDKNAIDEFWNHIKAATEFSIDKAYDGGFINMETRDMIKGMYEFYVPLRGFDESETDGTNYSILDRTSKSPVNNPVKTAKGRGTLSDGPLAYIASMAHTAIVVAEKNKSKQALWKMVVENKQFTDLFKLSRTYYIEIGKNEDGNPVYIESTERPDKDLFEKGLVKIHRTGIDVRGKTKTQSIAHKVPVYVNGYLYEVELEGTKGLRIAEAVNGLTNKHYGLSSYWIGKATRWMSANMTAKNPAFIPINHIRDVGFASIAMAIEGKNVGKFIANMPRAYKAISDNLIGLRQDTELAKQYLDFIENGGLTGYVHMEDIDTIRDQIIKDINRATGNRSGKQKTYDAVFNNKAMQWGAHTLDYFAQLSENSSRFACYLTEIESGSTKAEAAYAAKEITTNFNRKGEWGPYLNSLFAFTNAAIQGTRRGVQLAGQNPKAFIVAATSLAAVQFFLAEICRSFGGEDELGISNYDNLSEYVRQNNYIFPIGEGKFVTIPMPHFMRMFGSVGSLASDLYSGTKDADEIIGSMYSITSKEIPVDLGLDKLHEGPASIFSGVIPTPFKPFYEAFVTGEDFLGRDIAKKPYMRDMEDQIPQAKQSRMSTNKMLISFSEWLNEAGGGSENVSASIHIDEDGSIERSGLRGMMDINPSAIEHAVLGMLGGRATFFSNVFKSVSSVAKNEEVNTYTIPVARRLYQTPFRSSAWNIYIEAKDEISDIEYVESDLKKRRNIPILKKVITSNKERVEVFNTYDNAIRDLGKNMKIATRKRDYNRLKEKREGLVTDIAKMLIEYDKRKN